MPLADAVHPVRYLEDKVDAAARKAVREELLKWALAGGAAWLLLRRRRR
jgi:hypothetical protein